MELDLNFTYCWRVNPIDQRITAARLLALRDEPRAAEVIADLLEVSKMPAPLSIRAITEIDEFVRSGNATMAAQLIHADIVRRGQC